LRAFRLFFRHTVSSLLGTASACPASLFLVWQKNRSESATFGDAKQALTEVSSIIQPDFHFYQRTGIRMKSGWFDEGKKGGKAPGSESRGAQSGEKGFQDIDSRR